MLYQLSYRGTSGVISKPAGICKAKNFLGSRPTSRLRHSGDLLTAAIPIKSLSRGGAQGAASASWRSGHAEDCKSLHPGSIPGEASTHFLTALKSFLFFLGLEYQSFDGWAVFVGSLEFAMSDNRL